MARKKQILYPVVFMILLTAVYTFVLAFINESTVDIIAAQEALRVKRSVLYVLDLPSDGSADAVNQLYDAKLDTKPFGDDSYYIYKEDGMVVGYAFPYIGKGLWGSISGYMAISADLKTILGVDFVAHSETPGLGGRIDEEWFKVQFRGVPVAEAESLIFFPSDGGNIDAITGATSTSEAVRKIINGFVGEILDFAKEANL
ncbi:MAG TPA: NADH:quinone oxidoreductase [Clostridiales bacterium UBA8960]|jgi:Na+-transporting NADH:ubiquinone oxidoreductase subunit C|nr:NADH:quinone oxidoreductase [Clostridiales bacterium UBA8960]